LCYVDFAGMWRADAACGFCLCCVQSLDEYMDIVRDCVALDKNVLIARKYVAHRLPLMVSLTSMLCSFESLDRERITSSHRSTQQRSYIDVWPMEDDGISGALCSPLSFCFLSGQHSCWSVVPHI